MGALVFGSVAGRHAHADEPSLADKASARELFTEGMSLRSKGEVEGALEKFKAAYALWPSPSTGLELGRTHMMLGQLIEARERFLETAKMPPRPTETAAAQVARDEARSLAESLAPRIASLTFKIEGAPTGAKVRVSIDGRELPSDTLGATRKINPGKHKVSARCPDAADVVLELEIAEGASREVTLTFHATTEAPSSTKPAPAKASAPASAGTSAWVYVGFGVAGVGLLAGGVTGALAISKASGLRDSCDDGRCPPSAHADVDSYERLGTISTISFAVAGVGAAVGIYGLLAGPRKESEPRAHVTPYLGLGSAGLMGAF